MSEPLLTARELADRLGVSAGALLRWTRAGKVPGAVKLPSGAVRYVPHRIDEWLDECEMASGGTEKASPIPDAARHSGVSSVLSPIPLRPVAARTEEEPLNAC